MGVAHTVNALIEGDLFVVEIALPGQAQQPPTAILVEGPANFTCNVPFRPLGATLLRWRLLLSCDWRVCCRHSPACSVLMGSISQHRTGLGCRCFPDVSLGVQMHACVCLT